MPPLEVETQIRRTVGDHAIICLAFTGVAGIGSEGNHHGKQMREALHEISEHHALSGLIIDLRSLDYRFGDWIGSCCLDARLRKCRTCLVATGHTGESLRRLWEASRLESLIPIFQSLEEADEYVGSTQ